MQSSLLIHKSRQLQGEALISGSKNATLPILAASLLTDKKLLVKNPPHLSDVTFFIEMMMSLGTCVKFYDIDNIEIQTPKLAHDELSYNLARLMRASILLTGSLLARCGHARIAMPGGCVIGWRPIDQHLEGFKALGAEIEVLDDMICASAPKGLKGAEIEFDFITVTGTENIIMAATLADGTTTIRNAAQEPEVCALGNFLNSIGARISGLGTNTLTIEGVDSLTGGEVEIPPDRIEAGTYLVAGMMIPSEIRLDHINPNHLVAVLDKLREAGGLFKIGEDYIELDTRQNQSKAVDIVTGPYPGFPTDMQAQFTAMNAIAAGEADITDRVFKSRFKHVTELVRMGADIESGDGHIHIKGVESLRGCEVHANDLRASASLVLAGIAADGETIVRNVQHIDRGYERVEEKFFKLGADIRRI